jgi:hypothetical protein
MDAKEVLDSVFPSIDDDDKDYYRVILNRIDVRKMIKSVTKKDEIFMKLVTLKDYKSIRFQLIDFIVNKFCNQKLDDIRTDENEQYIFHILNNLGNYTERGCYKILDRKKEQILRLLESCELDFGTNDHTIVSRISSLRSATIFDPPDYSNSSAPSSSSSMSKKKKSCCNYTRSFSIIVISSIIFIFDKSNKSIVTFVSKSSIIIVRIDKSSIGESGNRRTYAPPC